jgi:GT2 family glycosyltransferase
MSADAYVDLLYLACNRLEFTQETFTTLLTTTDWRFVHELFVYDDGSRDGTREWLERHVGQAPVPSRLVHTRFGSPVAAMVHFIERASAPILAKTDNDAMLPPGWLRQSLEVLDRHPELALLGIEAMYPHRDDVELTRTYTPAEFISGLGLYRRAAFAQSRPTPYAKWFGFEEWQIGQGAGLIRGWITPALPVFLLDRFPLAPWTQYTEMYIRRGWQRSWPKYDPTSTLWQWRWLDQTPPTPAIAAPRISEAEGAFGNPVGKAGQGADPPTGAETATFKVVILSGRGANLIPCVQSVLAHEPALPPDSIIVVDDGARADAEAALPGVRWVQGVKPFIYARNTNLGMREAGTDVILLNDDARLLTPYGFTRLAQQAQARPDLGICSAGIQGVIGNPRQLASPQHQLRLETRRLAFVCVYIPQRVYNRIGSLDERFTGYGFEDNDYCTRVVASGLQLGIWDGCVVDHSGELPSTFRTRSDVWDLFQHNRRVFREKWGRDA